MQRIDTYTLNKVAGWVLFTALMVFGLNELSHIVYHAETPEQPGMIVEVAEVTPAVEDGEAGEAGPSIANLLAEADPAAGEAASRACQACHTFGQGEPHRVGPNLWDLLGAQIAHHEDYDYSDALQQMSDQAWTYEALDAFIAGPREFAPGTKMTYGGMGRPEQRADLIAYLRTLSEEPEPLPEPTAAEEEPEQEAQQQDETAEPQQAAEGAEPTPVAAGDPAEGEAAARQCQACHTFAEGEPHRVGPNLFGVVGAPIARHEDFAYSDALEQMSDQAWTPEALDQFIANPREFAPGTKMTYGGMRREEQRADLIAYLATFGGEAAAEPSDAAPMEEQQPAAEPEAPEEQQPAAENQETQAEATQQDTVGQIEMASEPETGAEATQQDTVGQIETAPDPETGAEATQQGTVGQIEAAPEPKTETEPTQQETVAQIEAAPEPETQAETTQPSEPQQADSEAAQPGPAAAGDPERGQAAARQCQACHTFAEGEPHRVGPNLWGVVGAQIAHHDDYAYSDALQQMSDQTWTPEALDQFIANPREFAPGTKMTYGGMRRDEQRADLIAYLRTLSE